MCQGRHSLHLLYHLLLVLQHLQEMIIKRQLTKKIHRAVSESRQYASSYQSGNLNENVINQIGYQQNVDVEQYGNDNRI